MPTLPEITEAICEELQNGNSDPTTIVEYLAKMFIIARPKIKGYIKTLEETMAELELDESNDHDNEKYNGFVLSVTHNALVESLIKIENQRSYPGNKPKYPNPQTESIINVEELNDAKQGSIFELKSVKVSVPKLPKPDSGPREFARFETRIKDALIQAEPLKEKAIREYFDEYMAHKSQTEHDWERMLRKHQRLIPMDRSLFQGLKNQLRSEIEIHEQILVESESWTADTNNGRRMLKLIKLEFQSETVREISQTFSEWNDLYLENIKGLSKYIIDIQRYVQALEGTEYELQNAHIHNKILHAIERIEATDAPISTIVEKYRSSEILESGAPVWKAIMGDLKGLVRRHRARYTKASKTQAATAQAIRTNGNRSIPIREEKKNKTCKWCDEPNHNWLKDCKVFPLSKVAEDTEKTRKQARDRGWRDKKDKKEKQVSFEPTNNRTKEIGATAAEIPYIILDSGAQIDSYPREFIVKGTEEKVNFQVNTPSGTFEAGTTARFFIPSLKVERQGLISRNGLHLCNPKRLQRETGIKWLEKQGALKLPDGDIVPTLDVNDVESFAAAAIETCQPKDRANNIIIAPVIKDLPESAPNTIDPVIYLKDKLPRGRGRGKAYKTIHDCLHLPADPRNCKVCLLAKMRRSYARGKTTRTGGKVNNTERSYEKVKNFGEKVTADWAYSNTPSVYGHIAIGVIRDIATGWMETMVTRKRPTATMSTQLVERLAMGGETIQEIQTDNGPEFQGSFPDNVRAKGIRPKKSVPNNSESNGIIEAAIKTINECTRAKLLQAWLPTSLWNFALQDAIYDLNRLWKKNGATPFERRYNRPFDDIPAFPFGCEATYLDVRRKRTTGKTLPKFAQSGRTGIVLGRADSGYIILDLLKILEEGKIKVVVTRDTKINRKEFPGRDYNMLNFDEEYEIELDSEDQEQCGICSKPKTSLQVSCNKCQNPIRNTRRHALDITCKQGRCLCEVETTTKEDEEYFKVTSENIQQIEEMREQEFLQETAEDQITANEHVEILDDVDDSGYDNSDDEGISIALEVHQGIENNTSASIANTRNPESDIDLVVEQESESTKQQEDGRNTDYTEQLEQVTAERGENQEQSGERSRILEETQTPHQDGNNDQNHSQESVENLRRSNRIRKIVDRGPILQLATVPISVNDALNNEEGIQAIRMEIKSIADHKALGKPMEKSEALKDPTSTFSSLMINVVKKHAEQDVNKQKTKGRLVIRGDLVFDNKGNKDVQTPGVYDKPTGLQAIRFTTLYGALKDNDYLDVDADTAFLQAEYGVAGGNAPPLFVSMDKRIPNEIYIEELELGEEFKMLKDPVFPVLMSIYGTNRGQIDFAAHLRNKLRLKNFVELRDVELGLFKRKEGGNNTLISVYVDDSRIAGPKCSLEATIKDIGNSIKMKKPSKDDTYVGVNYSEREIPGGKMIYCDLIDYIDFTIQEYTMTVKEYKYKKRTHPMSKISAQDILESQLSQSEYAKYAPKIIGKLLWICRNTRPDIAYAVHVLSKRLHSWNILADKVLEWLMQYLQTSRDLVLESRVMYEDELNFSIESWTDSDYAGCLFTGRSTTGYLTQIAGSRGTKVTIDWGSKQQHRSGSSSADCEITALDYAMNNSILPMEQIFTFAMEYQPRVTVRVDNNAAIEAVKAGYSVRMRHLPRTQRVSISRLHDMFVDEEMNMNLTRVNSDNNLADLFTKPLEGKRFQQMIKSIGLVYKQ